MGCVLLTVNHANQIVGSYVRFMPTPNHPNFHFSFEALSVELEAMGLLIQFAYGYLNQLPITAYGETLALLLQVSHTSVIHRAAAYFLGPLWSPAVLTGTVIITDASVLDCCPRVTPTFP